MRSSKNRSRSKSNRQRSIGNIVNRVFDSSGPEGKVRGTPQQIIEKYLALARDAQLGNDRVAEQNFLQHAEHYTRMLGEAQRELAREQEERQRQYGGPQTGHPQGNGQPGPARDQAERGQERGYNDRGQNDRGQNERGQNDRGQNERNPNDRSGERNGERGQGERNFPERDTGERDHGRSDSGRSDSGRSEPMRLDPSRLAEPRAEGRPPRQPARAATAPQPGEDRGRSGMMPPMPGGGTEDDSGDSMLVETPERRLRAAPPQGARGHDDAATPAPDAGAQEPAPQDERAGPADEAGDAPARRSRSPRKPRAATDPAEGAAADETPAAKGRSRSTTARRKKSEEAPADGE